MDNFSTIVLIVGFAFFFFWFFVLRKFKVPKIGAITMFTGGVKSGKSAVSLYFALKAYKRILRRWKISCFFSRLRRKELPEKPLLYSNIPLCKIDYCELTRDHLLRKRRLNFGSVVFLDEASLVADSMLGKEVRDSNINNNLLLFFKLFGHMTHGGCCVINSHCISDLHYALKRTTSTYYYVHSIGRMPLLKIARLREEKYSDDGTVVNTYNEDVEDSLKKVAFSSRVFKKFDSFCFSYFTDNLAVQNNEFYNTERSQLKARNLVSFRPAFYELSEDYKKEVSLNEKKVCK